MQTRLSVLIITKNAEQMLEQVLRSVSGLADETIVVDDSSTDRTIEIARMFDCKVYIHRQKSYGDQRTYGLSKCSNNWVLMLDSDEIVPPELKKEIIETIHSEKFKIVGYKIPFQNHFLGHKLYYGGEQYTKLVLFQKDKAVIISDFIHEHVEITGTVGILKHHILHYSYRTLLQTFWKFTDYARLEAIRKHNNRERFTVAKLMLYPPHMFWSRYVKDMGYKDHVSRILLDLGFAYMEFLTYFLLAQAHDEKKAKDI